jgi:glycosyltransferase involved in cell wall biosynthesis
VLFLGRFDVEVKGLDRMVEIARFVPEADFHLYGRAQDRRGLDLPRSAPANVYFHDPVFGRAKAAVFANATLYLQPSRWEAFPISATEAMALGVPCAMSENLHLTEMLLAYDAVLAIPTEPEVAAYHIRELLTNAGRLNELSRCGQDFVRSNCSPLAVARQYVAAYRSALIP